MSRVKKREDAPSVGRLPEVLVAQVDAAFIPYLKIYSALRMTDVFTDILVRYDLREREDAMKVALILKLEKVWREWTGGGARTVGTGTGKLPPGEFPFGDWVIDLFKEKGEVPPTRYAIQKALRSVPAHHMDRAQLSFSFMKVQ